jgi:hypothetical protein
MQDLDSGPRATDKGFPWHLLLVGAAVALAAVNASEYSGDHAPHSLVLAAAWLCWAFSWYAQPFRIRWGAKALGAIEKLPRHERVPEGLWNVVTIAALFLLLAGLALKFANAA